MKRHTRRDICHNMAQLMEVIRAFRDGTISLFLDFCLSQLEERLRRLAAQTNNRSINLVDAVHLFREIKYSTSNILEDYGLKLESRYPFDPVAQQNSDDPTVSSEHVDNEADNARRSLLSKIQDLSLTIALACIPAKLRDDMTTNYHIIKNQAQGQFFGRCAWLSKKWVGRLSAAIAGSRIAGGVIGIYVGRYISKFVDLVVKTLMGIK